MDGCLYAAADTTARTLCICPAVDSWSCCYNHLVPKLTPEGRTKRPAFRTGLFGALWSVVPGRPRS